MRACVHRYVCTPVCMSVCIHLLDLCTHVLVCTCMNVCMHVCMLMSVCLCVCYHQHDQEGVSVTYFSTLLGLKYKIVVSAGQTF